MPADLMRWYRRLGLDLYEGYAMTEDFAYSHTGDTGDHSLGTVGRPFPDVQARIADDGEVLVKSPGQHGGLLQGARAERRELHRRRLLPHR
jgi:long-chain acyl-CoA synthetase